MKTEALNIFSKRDLRRRVLAAGLVKKAARSKEPSDFTLAARVFNAVHAGQQNSEARRGLKSQLEGIALQDPDTRSVADLVNILLDPERTQHMKTSITRNNQIEGEITVGDLHARQNSSDHPTEFSLSGAEIVLDIRYQAQGKVEDFELFTNENSKSHKLRIYDYDDLETEGYPVPHQLPTINGALDILRLRQFPDTERAKIGELARKVLLNQTT
jgi:hypothetical protein